MLTVVLAEPRSARAQGHLWRSGPGVTSFADGAEERSGAESERGGQQPRRSLWNCELSEWERASCVNEGEFSGRLFGPCFSGVPGPHSHVTDSGDTQPQLTGQPR